MSSTDVDIGQQSLADSVDIPPSVGRGRSYALHLRSQTMDEVMSAVDTKGMPKAWLSALMLSFKLRSCMQPWLSVWPTLELLATTSSDSLMFNVSLLQIQKRGNVEPVCNNSSSCR